VCCVFMLIRMASGSEPPSVTETRGSVIRCILVRSRTSAERKKRDTRLASQNPFRA
jgi:hypothetical protein